MAPDTLLVVNAGSSSIKFQLFTIGEGERLDRSFRGLLDGIGTHPRLVVRDAEGAVAIDRAFEPARVPDVASAQDIVGAWLSEQAHAAPLAVGHRVVHGGSHFSAPIAIDETVLATLERFVPLAPLHQPNNLAPIRAIRRRRPDLLQVACFDTAFHRGHSEVADRFAIPEALYREGVRRYGFHGLSYEYISGRLAEIAPDLARARVIVAHLGSGASMCAMKGGQSVESTMGFTALDGLPMGTRPGQLDAGVVLYLMREKGMDSAAIERLLYHECGLKGLSGISSDMRDLIDDPDPGARLAVDYFIYRASMAAAALASAMGGLDGLVFTAGIGENSAPIRSMLAGRLGWLGCRLDPPANARHDSVISTADSRVVVRVIPTDEEAMIARHTLALVRALPRGQ